jgi:plastocyanin domain-containing protein
MTIIDVGVIAAGAAAVAWVVWYFFFAKAGEATAVASGTGPQEIRIAVHGGYDPSVVHVQAGRPVRLRFDRQETSSCSEEVVFPDFGVRKFLPAFKETVVEIEAPSPGRYEFTCGMSMLRGTMVAE